MTETKKGDFTVTELLQFNKPPTIYLALNGIIFDVSTAAAMYGPGGHYHALAGKDATVYLAKQSLDTSIPTNTPLTDEDKQRLNTWYTKFISKYPVVGKLITEETSKSSSPSPSYITPEELSQFTGHNNTPILLSIKGTVFNVTTAGHLYGEGKSYHSLVGKDSSRALAKTSLDPADTTVSSKPSLDFSDLSEEERKTLDEWYEKFKKKYPVVGYLKLPSASKL